MSLKNVWGDETKTYIYSEFTPNWSWDEFKANRPQYQAMVQSVPHRVDFIADFSKCSILPTNFFVNSEWVFSTRLNNEGYVIIVGASSFIRRMYELVARILPNIQDHVHFAPNLGEAADIVQCNREVKAIHS